MPIPVEGDVQIFANPECTEYADGTKMPVYARVNNPWAFNETWAINDNRQGNCIACRAPEDEYPDDPFCILLWMDFTSSNFEKEFTAGQVVEINVNEGVLPVTNPTVIFTKP